MKILINNQESIFDDGISLQQVMERCKPNSNGIAAALNNRVVARKDWPVTRVHEGDRIIIISAVCGG